jgi:predicted nucleotidyltransferase
MKMQRKMALYNAQHVSATSIQKHIVQDHILVLNAEVNTTQSCVKRIQILQQNVHCVEETTWLIIKVVTYTKTYKKQAEKQQINLDGTLVNHITETLTSTIIINFLY